MINCKSCLMLMVVVYVSACTGPSTLHTTETGIKQTAKQTKHQPKKKKADKAEIKGFDASVQLQGKVYANDADAIERLLAAASRSPEEDQYLVMLARKYDFYGKPENLQSALIRARQ